MWLELIILAVIGGTFFYRWVTKYYDFFKKRNIPFKKPVFLLGTGKDTLFGIKPFINVIIDFYNRQNGMVYGIFDGRKPIYLVRDPQLVKHITIKDFEHFVNRPGAADLDGSGNLLINSLFFMQNERWRDMRNTLSPAFTGSKMRQMSKLIAVEIGESMKYLKDQIKENKAEEMGLELNVKDFTSRLTVNIIASTAFGLQIDSFKNRNNEFFKKAQRAVNFTTWQQVKFMIQQLFPKAAKILRIRMFDQHFVDYFMHLVLDTMKYRVEHNIQRPDMINLLMEARGIIPTDTPKSHFREWSDVEAVAQCFLFFFAGMEPSSAVMCFAVNELMEHPEVQQKLYEEIQKVSEDLENETVSYETLQKMTYLDKVVSEVLRKWPVTLISDRECNKDYVYESQGKKLEFKKGDILRIPMVAIQRDPKYYPKPEVLDPERFNEENKAQLTSGTYLPFGLGPRICIANRFAQMEVKAFLFHLLSEYRLEAAAKSMRPLKMKKYGFQAVPEKGFWIQLVPRK